MANELQLLNYIKETWFPANAHLRAKAGVDEIKIAEKIAAQYDFVGGKFFDKQSQQEIESSVDAVIFKVAKEHNFLEVKNSKGFNRKYGNLMNENQMSRAKEFTRKQLDAFLTKHGYAFNDERYGGNEIRAHVVGKILDNGFIAEASKDGEGIELRQLKNGYWTLKSFDVQSIVEEAARGMIDLPATEIRRKEIEAGLFEKAMKLAKRTPDERTGQYQVSHTDAKSVLETLRKEHFAQRVQKRLTIPTEAELRTEFENEFIHQGGFLTASTKDLGLREKMQLEQYVKEKLQTLSTPTIDQRETLTEFENRYRNYGKLTEDY